MALSKAEREFHQRTATNCFNKAWDYLDMKTRDSKAEEEMLHLAHASRYHWGIVGTPRQQAVGDWQLGRVYAAVGDAELSLQYALACLHMCEKKCLDDLVPSAMEGVARAYVTAGDQQNAVRVLRMARKKLYGLKLDSEDRKVYSSQIRETQALIRRARAKV